MVLGLPGGAECSEGTAVEAVDHGDDLVASRLAMEPRQLDRRLHGLGPTVAKEAFAVPAGPLAQGLSQVPLSFGVPGVGHMDELAHLSADRLHHARRAVAQQIATPAWKEIQVAVPLGVPHVGTLATHEAD